MQRLLARGRSGGTLPGEERLLQELCALAGSDVRRQRQRRQRWRAARHGGLRLCAGFPIELGEHAPAETRHRQGAMASVTWQGAMASIA